MSSSVPPLLGRGLVIRQVGVAPEEIVLVRALLEAEEGLGILFAEKGGEVTLATTESQKAELDRFLESAMTAIPSLVPR